MKYFPFALLFAVGGALGACNSSPAVNDQPISGDHPAPAETVVTVDTTAARTHGSVPFVNPTKIGRILGSKSPSPPASRTR
ncbi:hypothetical protein GCM10022409_19570 [Hymenobacter glaciei]|uniref:Uncharacterized protein n=1 Tax=Hymenobacter glaciei TaxID=877209 RepID=A0ABP7U560_9BACT